MDIQEEKSSTSAGWYLLGGLIAGAVAGVLLAPKSGAETREDLENLRRRGAENARSLIARIGEALPSRVKAAAVFGAAKGATKEAVSETRDRLKQFSAT
ncbi:MAG: YtxH domain-containing protein [Elusimicrobiota bacterium]